MPALATAHGISAKAQHCSTVTPRKICMRVPAPLPDRGTHAVERLVMT